MHGQVIEYLKKIKFGKPDVFRDGPVLEVGSMIMNGSPRGFFQDVKEYVGLDWREGPGVDYVSIAHEYKGKPDCYFKTIISTEMLEHDPHFEKSLVRMTELLMIGGSIIITCAGPGRPTHEIHTAPAGDGYFQGTYYNPISVNKILIPIIANARFAEIITEDDTRANDSRILFYNKLSQGEKC